MVSVWASEEGVAQGQVAADAKSNEITAIPQLLARFDLTDTLVTIDAMRCQKDIAKQIVAGSGDCVIAVKDNQPKLAAAVESSFLEQLERDREDLRYRGHETRDEGHGRIDKRSYYLTKTPNTFEAAKDWPWNKVIGIHGADHRVRRGRESDEARYYISPVGSAANDSAERSAGIGRSSRCIG